MERNEDGTIERMPFATKIDTYIKQFSNKSREELEHILSVNEQRVSLPDMQGDTTEVLDARFTFDAQIEAVKYLLNHEERLAA